MFCPTCGQRIPVKPRRLPPARWPRRYATEETVTYRARVYRWRCWLDAEPRPDLWYASTTEIQDYQQWRDFDPLKGDQHE